MVVCELTTRCTLIHFLKRLNERRKERETAVFCLQLYKNHNSWTRVNYKTDFEYKVPFYL